ncbi:hypothetical protein JMUB6875_01480 [Nocardia sp. JMUB6875]|uniref:DUF7373 family lipoprotein n=1 Tax=Nocardia sp. JMUB6875 TaxID=3158170 RepID=UPI0032E59EA7
MLRSSDRRIGPMVCYLIVALVAALLSGCRVVSGTATNADIDLRTLDFGEFGADPLTEPPNGSEKYGRIVESARMAEATVDVREIDGSLGVHLPALIPRPGNTAGYLAAVARPILTKYGMLAGYSVFGDNYCHSGECPVIGVSRSVRLTVLRLPDEAAAQHAAAEIEAADFGVSPDNVPVTLPKYPAAGAHWRPALPTLGVVVAQGTFVITVFVTHPTTDLPALTTLATTALDIELPVLDRFHPTPKADIANLPFDRDGMLARMVPTTRGTWPTPYVTVLEGSGVAGDGAAIEASGVVYGPTGAGHWLLNGAKSPGVEAGEVEAMAVIDRRWLIRFRDAGAARRFFEFDSVTAIRQTEMAAPAVPDTKCLRREAIPPVYYCDMHYGRYFALVHSTDEKSAHQMAAAQYALLVRKR